MAEQTHDYLATMLHNPNVPISEYKGLGVTGDNTQLLKQEDYEKIPEIQAMYQKEDGTFDKEAFSKVYKDVKDSYSLFQQDAYETNVLDFFAQSYDAFWKPTKKPVIQADYVNPMNDTSINTSGFNVVRTSTANLSARELGQMHQVFNWETQQFEDWTPNDKHGLFKAFFIEPLVLAQYDKDEDEVVNGRVVHHQKGDFKLHNGSTYYETLGDRSVQGKDLLRYTDVITVDGSTANKFDFLDHDDVKAGVGKTVVHTAAQVIPAFLGRKVGAVYGLVGASLQLSQALPQFGTAINSAITGNEHNATGRFFNNAEAVTGRFAQTSSDYGRAHFASMEGLGNMIGSTFTQLMQQKAIAQIPGWLSSNKGLQNSEFGANLALCYMAGTSAMGTYQDFRQAGADERVAGIAMLANTAALYKLMNIDYFRDTLFKGTFMDESKLRGAAMKNAAEMRNQVCPRLTPPTNAKEGRKLFNTMTSWYHTKLVPGLTNAELLNRMLSEGTEEVMEEFTTDSLKAITKGLNALGIDCTEEGTLDFGVDLKDIATRYGTSFIGGAIGGGLFYGQGKYEEWLLKKYNQKRGITFTDPANRSDLAQIAYAVANNQDDEIEGYYKKWHDAGVFGPKNLDVDGNPITAGGISANDFVYNKLLEELNIIRQQIKSTGIGVSEAEVDAYFKLGYATDGTTFTDRESVRRYLRADAITGLESFSNFKNTFYHTLADITALKTQIEEKEKEFEPATDATEAEKIKMREQVNTDHELQLLKARLLEKQNYLTRLRNGEETQYFIGQGFFAWKNKLEHDMGIEGMTSSFVGMSKDNFCKAAYGTDYASLSSEDQLKADVDYANYTEDGRSDVFKAYDLYLSTAERISDDINNTLGSLKPLRGDRFHSTSTQYLEQVREKQMLDRALANKKALEEKESLTEQEKQDLADLNKAIDELQQRTAMHLDPLTAVSYEYKDTEYVDLLNTAYSQFNALEELRAKIAQMANGEEKDRASEEFDAKMQDIKAAIKAYIDKVAAMYNEAITSNATFIGNSEVERLAKMMAQYRSLVLNGKTVHAYLSEKLNFLQETLVNDTLYPGLKNILMDAEKREKLINLLEAYSNEMCTSFKGDALRELITFLEDNDAKDAIDLLLNGIDENLQEQLDERMIAEKQASAPVNADFDDYIKAVEEAQTEDDLIAVGEMFFEEQGDDIDTSSKEAAIADLRSKAGFNVNGSVNTSARNAYAQYKAMGELLPTYGVHHAFATDIHNLMAYKGMVKVSPAFELLKVLRAKIGTEDKGLIELMEQEAAGLISMADIEDYIIKNADIISALRIDEELQKLMKMVQAVLAGASNGFHASINACKGDLKLVELDPVTAKTINDDFEAIFNKLETLLAIHNLNSQQALRVQKDITIVSRPRWVKFLLNIPADKQRYFGVDENGQSLVDFGAIFAEAGGTSEMLDGIDENNYADIEPVLIKFEQGIYDAIRKNKALFNGDGKKTANCDAQLARMLCAMFGDKMWMQLSTQMDKDPEGVVTPMNAAYYILSCVSLPAKTFFVKDKAIVEDENYDLAPVYPQELGARMSIAFLNNVRGFNTLLDYATTDSWAALDKANNIAADELSSMSHVDRSMIASDIRRAYLKNQRKLHNLVTILGGAGVGKTTGYLQTTLKMIADSNPEIIVAAPKQKQVENLAENAGQIVMPKGTFTKEQLFETITGKKSSEWTIEDHKDKGLAIGANTQLIETTHKAVGFSDAPCRILVFDEIGKLNMLELEQLTRWAERNNVVIIGLGDDLQEPAFVKVGSDTISSGLEDCLYFRCPELTASMRAGCAAKIENYCTTRQALMKIRTKLDTSKDLSASNITSTTNGVIGTGIIMRYYESEDGKVLYGDKVVNVDEANRVSETVKYAQRFNVDGQRVAIITDSVDKYVDKIDGVDIVDINEAQGGEWDYVILDADLRRRNEGNNYTLLKAIYTMSQRAIYGTVLLNVNENQWTKEIPILGNSASNSSLNAMKPRNKEQEAEYRQWRLKGLSFLADEVPAPILTIDTQTPPPSPTSKPNTPPPAPQYIDVKRPFNDSEQAIFDRLRKNPLSITMDWAKWDELVPIETAGPRMKGNDERDYIVGPAVVAESRRLYTAIVAGMLPESYKGVIVAGLKRGYIAEEDLTNIRAELAAKGIVSTEGLKTAVEQAIATYKADAEEEEKIRAAEAANQPPVEHYDDDIVPTQLPEVTEPPVSDATEQMPLDPPVPPTDIPESPITAQTPPMPPVVESTEPIVEGPTRATATAGVEGIMKYVLNSYRYESDKTNPNSLYTAIKKVLPDVDLSSAQYNELLFNLGSFVRCGETPDLTLVENFFKKYFPNDITKLRPLINAVMSEPAVYVVQLGTDDKPNKTVIAVFEKDGVRIDVSLMQMNKLSKCGRVKKVNGKYFALTAAYVKNGGTEEQMMSIEEFRQSHSNVYVDPINAAIVSVDEADLDTKLEGMPEETKRWFSGTNDGGNNGKIMVAVCSEPALRKYCNPSQWAKLDRKNKYGWAHRDKVQLLGMQKGCISGEQLLKFVNGYVSILSHKRLVDGSHAYNEYFDEGASNDKFFTEEDMRAIIDTSYAIDNTSKEALTKALQTYYSKGKQVLTLENAMIFMNTLQMAHRELSSVVWDNTRNYLAERNGSTLSTANVYYSPDRWVQIRQTKEDGVYKVFFLNDKATGYLPDAVEIRGELTKDAIVNALQSRGINAENATLINGTTSVQLGRILEGSKKPQIMSTNVMLARLCLNIDPQLANDLDAFDEYKNHVYIQVVAGDHVNSDSKVFRHLTTTSGNFFIAVNEALFKLERYSLDDNSIDTTDVYKKGQFNPVQESTEVKKPTLVEYLGDKLPKPLLDLDENQQLETYNKLLIFNADSVNDVKEVIKTDTGFDTVPVTRDSIFKEWMLCKASLATVNPDQCNFIMKNDTLNLHIFSVSLSKTSEPEVYVIYKVNDQWMKRQISLETAKIHRNLAESIEDPAISNFLTYSLTDEMPDDVYNAYEASIRINDNLRNEMNQYLRTRLNNGDC